MGRAIEMENQLELHKSKIKKLEELVSDLEKTMDAILEYEKDEENKSKGGSSVKEQTKKTNDKRNNKSSK